MRALVAKMNILFVMEKFDEASELGKQIQQFVKLDGNMNIYALDFYYC